MQEHEGVQLDAHAQQSIAQLQRSIEGAKRQAQVAIIEARAKEIEDLAEAVLTVNPFELVDFLVEYIQHRRNEIRGMIAQVVADDQQRAAAEEGQVA